MTLQARYGGHYALCFLRCLNANVANYGRAASLAAQTMEYWNTSLIVHRGKLYRL